MAEKARSRIWLLVIVMLVLASGLVAFFLWNPFARKPVSNPLDGDFSISISSAVGGKRGVSVEAPGALPVHDGDSMALDAHFSEPAYCFLLHINSQGQVLPLYPWNIDELEVNELSVAPPVTGPTKRVWSPARISAGWRFNKGAGLETVLLLARRTPLPEQVKLSELLAPLPATRLGAPEEIVRLRFDRSDSSASMPLARHRGTEAESKEGDRPLLERMEKLREHFEIVRALRFAHQSK